MKYQIYAGKTKNSKDHKLVGETTSLVSRNEVVAFFTENGYCVTTLTYYPDGTVCASQTYAKEN